MIRLRCLLQLLLLLVAASVVVSDIVTYLSGWQRCGTTKLCIVHKSCLKPAQTKGWTVYKSPSFTYTQRPSDYVIECERYITIEPTADLKGIARIYMRDNTISRDKGMILFFGEKKNDMTPQILCKTNSASKDETTRFEVHQLLTKPESTVHCDLNVKIADDSDIRTVLTELAGGVSGNPAKLFISDKDDQGNNYAVDISNLNDLQMLCEGDLLTDAYPKKELVTTEDEFQTESDIRPTQNAKYNLVALDERDKAVTCPAGYAMRLQKKGTSEYGFVKEGLKCQRGYLAADVKTKTGSEKVKTGYSTKCALKKCATCNPPARHHLKGASSPPVESPLYDPADEGDRCRTLTCPKKMVVTVRKAGSETELKMHNSPTLSCAKNTARNGQFWDVEGGERRELIDVACTDEFYCTKMLPLNKGTCKTGDKNCLEPTIMNDYQGVPSACPEDFDLINISPATGNRQTLHTISFNCDKHNARWTALDKQNSEVTIPFNSTLVCERKEKYVATTTETPFLAAFRVNGSLWPLYLFGGGVFLVVVAVIVIGVVCIILMKRKKAAKRKAMESVSVTYKPPPKHAKKKKSSDRKQRQVSVVNSVTGDTNSGPNSQSGGSVPIAPPSRLFDPAKGVSKPAKGCAVLDLTTGKSKNLQWTNHAGDGPPTQKRESWATSNSNQDDIASAIKFAPEEQEALKQAGNMMPKKQKSRQNSIEYNFGDAKTVKNEDAKRANKKWASSDVPVHQDSESKRVEGDDSTIKK